MISLEISNLKGIKHLEITLPLEKGLYTITGENGIGKSTIFSVLAKLVYGNALEKAFKFGNEGAEIKFTYGGIENNWRKEKSWLRIDKNKEILINGTFESSLIFGSRFANTNKSFISLVNYIYDVDLVDADRFVTENLGKILRNDERFYRGLKRIKNNAIAQKIGFERAPYYWINNEKQIKVAQLFMSSGEMLLIGLLDFLSRQKNFVQNKANSCGLILIDEIELALHASAQNRLLNLLSEISDEENLCIYFATHSLSIINQMNPSHIFHLERDQNDDLVIINPCYSAYATRSLYTNDKFDFLLLVEDKFTNIFIDIVLQENNLKNNKLIKILPCGGWEQTLKIQNEFVQSKIAGSKCKIISILDGDIEEKCKKYCEKNKKFATLQKLFLPIPSIEKFLLLNCIEKPNSEFIKKFGDNYFPYKSLQEILKEFVKNYTENDKNKDSDKKLVSVLENNVQEQGKSLEVFDSELCKFIYSSINHLKFDNAIGSIINY